ncbi:hypothetical protein ACYX7E_07515 [Luteimonas sp. RIT-PG2_3]
MSLLYEIRYLFTSATGALTEIQRLDLPDSAPKHHVYHWLWISDLAVKSLRFVSMQSVPQQMRTFREALLHFDESSARLRWRDGETTVLVAEAHPALNAEQERLVRNHLS